MKRIALLLATSVVLAGIPASATACPVCFSAKKGSREAFLATTLLLSGLPWLMAGGFFVWYRRRSLEIESDQD